MGRIRILSDAVANKIAAGEVVERPASVVKELLENSLDADSSEIRIDVESGGRRLIRVADNGFGMLRDDALLAFERHATSKLADVQDLLHIATLGFRGEALPSISSVSRLALETRSRGEETGTRVEVAGGKILRCDEAALAPGTVVTVRDLFYNVPARKKFLRSDPTELAHIGALVTHYSLAHPGKSIRLRHGSIDLLDVTPVEQMAERVFQVFGSQMMDELIDLGARERELRVAPASIEGADQGTTSRVFLVRGFVSRPQIQKLNRNSIYLFVNGRLIRDRLLLHAISAAYHNLIPPASYPFALIFIDCDAEEVDVNVHPSKTEVRFRHGSFLHDFVRDTVRERLLESRPSGSMPPASPGVALGEQPASRLPFSEFTRQIEGQEWTGTEAAASGTAGLRAVAPELAPVREADEDLPGITLRGPSSFPQAPGDAAAPDETGATGPREDLGTRVTLPVPDTHGGFPADLAGYTAATPASLDDLRPLGQLHSSFIIAAGRDGLWIIDQHVAHERVLFEKILRERARGAVERQQLLMPIVIEITAAQQIEYARIAGELNASGFESEPFGARTISIQATPASLAPGQVEKVIFEILEIAERELRRASVEDLRRAVAASIACRAAIKINTRLDQEKMQWLLSALAAAEFPMSCPHGRPIALRYSMAEILRGFHRI